MKKKKYHYKTARDEEIRKMLLEYNMTSVAKHFGVSHQRILQIVAKNNFPTPNKGVYTVKQIEEYKEALLHFPRAKVAQMFGLSYGRVCQFAVKYNIPPAKDYVCHCATEIYAKGMCKSCYERKRR